VTGMPASVASHGSVLPLTNTATSVDEVLIPFYADGSAGGSYYLRAKYQPGTGQLLAPQSFRRIIANDDSPATEDLRYTEPSFVRVGDPADPDIFLTYGNRYDYFNRPTRGVLFDNPLAATWSAVRSQRADF
jgi:hypothetical protein